MQFQSFRDQVGSLRICRGGYACGKTETCLDRQFFKLHLKQRFIDSLNLILRYNFENNPFNYGFKYTLLFVPSYESFCVFLFVGL